MAMVDSTLVAALDALFTEADNAAKTSTPMTKSQFNTKLAKCISDFIKTATVTTPLGVPVSTTGTAAAQTGATTAPGVGTIS